MKLFYIIIFTSLIVSFNSPASKCQFTYIGIKGGYNMSRVLPYTGSDAGYDKSFTRKAINFGLFIEYYLGYNLSLRLETFYSMRGFEGYDPQLKGTFIQKYNYIEVPLLIQYSLPVNFLLRPKIFAGPEISFLHDAESVFEYQQYYYEMNYKDFLSRHEYGIIVGIGTAYNFRYGLIDFDIKYDYGLSDILADKYSQDPGSILNTVSFNIGLGYKL